jgi:hypothetical protein
MPNTSFPTPVPKRFPAIYDCCCRCSNDRHLLKGRPRDWRRSAGFNFVPFVLRPDDNPAANADNQVCTDLAGRIEKAAAVPRRPFPF